MSRKMKGIVEEESVIEFGRLALIFIVLAVLAVILFTVIFPGAREAVLGWFKGIWENIADLFTGWFG